MAPGLHQLLSFFIHDGADALAAHLQDASGLLLRLNERLAIGDALHHGLFEVHIFAGVHGVDRDFLVPVVGRGDDDGVHVGPRQNFAVIARDENILTVDLVDARQAALVDIARGDQL